MQWMEDMFKPQMQEKANRCTQVLLLDGHSSHHSAELFEFVKAHKIEVLGYPLHTTHALQGLDIVCFAKMKKAWKDEITMHESHTMGKVAKTDFAEVFG